MPHPPRHASPSPPRLAAASTLLELPLSSDRDATRLLDHQCAALRLDPRDMRMATALVMAVLRREAWLDSQYAGLLTRPPDSLDDRARIILRMAAAQRFLMDRVPPHAIVDDSVRLARALGMERHAAGFVNAVARRIVERAAPLEPEPDAPPERRIELACSLPRWIARMLLDHVGTADALRLADALAAEPGITLRPNRLRTTPAALAAHLAEAGIATTPGILLEDALRVSQPGAMADLLATPAFTDGWFYIQDEASQAVGLVVAPRPGESVLDLCAAPGGKATHLAELAGGEARIVACDPAPHRLDLLRANIARLGTPGVDVADAAALGGGAVFDAVLVDAPCSALGTLRRHPEVRHRLSRAGLRRSGEVQAEILASAAAFTRPGGRLVYSTCSFTHAENRDVVGAFLEAHPDFRHAAPAQWPAPLRHLRGDDGIARTWPAHPQVDGFGIALLTRSGA